LWERGDDLVERLGNFDRFDNLLKDFEGRGGLMLEAILATTVSARCEVGK
jgi:hypothetical protein